MLHITSGDIAGEVIRNSSVPGEVLVWHDILYDGIRSGGWPEESDLTKRALFLETYTDGGLHRDLVKTTLINQYSRLEDIEETEKVLLWFDACLFDQSMLAHVLTCLSSLEVEDVELICIDHFPGISPFNGLGQLNPEQISTLLPQKSKVSEKQFAFAKTVDEAFAAQSVEELEQLSQMEEAPLQWVPPAASRWLQEIPDANTGQGLLETLILEALEYDRLSPPEIYEYVSAKDKPPQYWGDITLWAKINGLATRVPALLTISGPTDKLPQWETSLDLNLYTITRI